MDLSQINYLAVIVAAASAFVVGSVWYSPILFAKPWMKENNFTEEDTKDSNMGKIFSITFILELIIAFNLAAFIGPETEASFGFIAGFLAGFGWVAMGLGVTYMFMKKSFKLLLIDAGYHVVSFTIMGGIIGLWK